MVPVRLPLQVCDLCHQWSVRPPAIHLANWVVHLVMRNQGTTKRYCRTRSDPPRLSRVDHAAGLRGMEKSATFMDAAAFYVGLLLASSGGSPLPVWLDFRQKLTPCQELIMKSIDRRWLWNPTSWVMPMSFILCMREPILPQAKHLPSDCCLSHGDVQCSQMKPEISGPASRL